MQARAARLLHHEVGGTMGSDSTRDASWFLLLCVGDTGPAAAGGTARGLGDGGQGSSGPRTMTCFDCNDLFCPWPSEFSTPGNLPFLWT